MSKQADWPFVINLGNSIIGVSVLAMPFCFKQCGVLLGMLLLGASAWLTNTSCSLLMKAAISSKKRSYEFLALHSFGAVGKLCVEISIIGMLIGTCIAFHVIIGDLGPAIVSKILGVENTSNLRTFLMVFLAVFFALPLGLLRDLDSLSNISAISLGFYSVFVAEVFSAAFPNLWSGVWVTKVEIWNPEGVFKCLPIYSLSFGCQTQLFVMYDALLEPSAKRMSSITKNAINMCSAVYLMVGFFGYVAFCDEEISGDVLMNFRPTIFSEAVKLGFVLSIAVSFPLVIFPCRASLHTLIFAKQNLHESFGGSQPIPNHRFKAITFCIVFGTLIVGIFVPNIEFVLAITGATMGSMICYIFPAIIFIRLMSISMSSKSTAQLVLFLGVTILLASTYTTLYSQDKTQPKPVESVVKIAPPDNPAEADVNNNLLQGIEAPKDEKIDEIEKAGDDVIKEHENAIEDKKDIGDDKDSEKGEKRQEPPIPHAPLDTEEKAKEQAEKNEEAAARKAETKSGEEQKVGKDIDTKKEEANLDDQPIKDGELAINVEAKEEMKDQVMDEEKKDDKRNGEDEKGDLKESEDKVGKEGKKEDIGDTKDDLKSKQDEQAGEAKQLIEELKEQRDEQKKLIEQQKELIEELKQHKKEAHEDLPKQMKTEPAPVQEMANVDDKTKQILHAAVHVNQPQEQQYDGKQVEQIQVNHLQQNEAGGLIQAAGQHGQQQADTVQGQVNQAQEQIAKANPMQSNQASPQQVVHQAPAQHQIGVNQPPSDMQQFNQQAQQQAQNQQQINHLQDQQQFIPPQTQQQINQPQNQQQFNLGHNQQQVIQQNQEKLNQNMLNQAQRLPDNQPNIHNNIQQKLPDVKQVDKVQQQMLANQNVDSGKLAPIVQHSHVNGAQVLKDPELQQYLNTGKSRKDGQVL